MTTNVEWAGAVGDVWAAEWRRTDRSFADLSRHLDAAILAHAGPDAPAIVDIGCGAGTTSIAVATARPDASVTGVDLSAALVAVARERGADLPNLRFTLSPAEAALPALAPIDLFVSRHGVMFFADPVVGFSAIRQAGAPDARIVFSCFRAPALNPWVAELVAAINDTPPPAPDGYAPGPFAFADREFVYRMLGEAGWREIEATPIDYRYRAGAGADPVADALNFFRRIGPTARELRATPPDTLGPKLDRVTEVLQRHATADVVDFSAAAWIWSARAS